MDNKQINRWSPSCPGHPGCSAHNPGSGRVHHCWNGCWQPHTHKHPKHTRWALPACRNPAAAVGWESPPELGATTQSSSQGCVHRLPLLQG